MKLHNLSQIEIKQVNKLISLINKRHKRACQKFSEVYIPYYPQYITDFILETCNEVDVSLCDLTPFDVDFIVDDFFYNLSFPRHSNKKKLGD